MIHYARQTYTKHIQITLNVKSTTNLQQHLRYKCKIYSICLEEIFTFLHHGFDHIGHEGMLSFHDELSIVVRHQPNELRVWSVQSWSILSLNNFRPFNIIILIAVRRRRLLYRSSLLL